MISSGRVASALSCIRRESADVNMKLDVANGMFDRDVSNTSMSAEHRFSSDRGIGLKFGPKILPKVVKF